MKDNSNISRTIIDNWMLELAAKLVEGKDSLSLEDQLSLQEEVRVHRNKVDSIVSYLERSLEPEQEISMFAESYLDRNCKKIRHQMLIALFQLLDLLVISDEIIYDAEMAVVWNRLESIQPIIPLLTSIKLSKHIKNKLITDSQFSSTIDAPTIVGEGALYYFELGKLLGISYWPSPERAWFLRNKVYTNLNSSFVWELGKSIDSNLKEITDEVYASLMDIKPNLAFPGFGSAILANCNSRSDVFLTTMQFRNTKEAREFRKWLREMDEALQVGNIRKISQGLQDVQDVINSVQRELAIRNKPDKKVDLQIGLSPSVTIDLKTVSSIFEHFKPKPLSIVFLRNHLYRVLESANVWEQAWRLFPETRLRY